MCFQPPGKIPLRIVKYKAQVLLILRRYSLLDTIQCQYGLASKLQIYKSVKTRIYHTLPLKVNSALHCGMHLNLE